MVLDWHISPSTHSDATLASTESFVEVAYGNDRRDFAGMHRFEISRQKGGEDLRGEEGIILSYSSSSCNPAADKPIFPRFNSGLVWRFHKFYAMCLFQDGVREVLSAA